MAHEDGEAQNQPVDAHPEAYPDGPGSLNDALIEDTTMASAPGGSEIEGSEADAEGEEVDYEEIGEPVGMVKIQDKGNASEEDDDEAALESMSEEGDFNGDDDAASEDSSSSATEAEEEWEAESDAAAEGEAEITDPNRCM